MLLVSSHLGQTASGWSFRTLRTCLGKMLSSQAPPSGVKNSNIPVRLITCSRNRRLRCECCLNTMLEHPGAPNRWLWATQEHQKGSQVSPKRRRGATKSTRSEAEKVPKSTQKEAKRAIESSKAKCVKKSEMLEVEIVLPPGRGHDFRCQSRGDRGTCPEGERLTPYGRRSLSAWGSDLKSRHIHEETCR